jgi:hypothetical protein
MREDAPILNHVRGAEHPVLRMPLGQALGGRAHGRVPLPVP